MTYNVSLIRAFKQYLTCYILQDKWARLDLHNGLYFSDRKTDCLLMNFFVLREEFFRQLVCLIDKEGYVLIRELVLIAIFGNVGREKKRHQKILFTLQLTSKFTWTKIMVSVDGLVISQIAGGLSISQCLLSVTFLQLDQVKFSFVRKAYRAMNCYSRTKPERFKYQQNEFFLVKILYHFNFHWYGIQSLFAKLFQIDLSR